MDDLKNGGVYESGIILATAQKTLKYVPRRNKGPKETWIFIYYCPDYFIVKGHKDYMLALCLMKKQSKEGRQAALKVIQTEQMEQEQMKLIIGE